MQEFSKLAQGIALEAGDIMLSHFGLSVAYTIKEDHTPVTEADKKINDLVIERISTVYPEHSLIGEEGEKRTTSQYAWVFDPIDGTIDYLRGIPTNVFALALVKDGEPVLGVVYDPYQKRLYRALQGEGAFMNDERISTASRTELKHSFIECDGLRGFKNLNFIDALKEQGARFLSLGSTIYGQMLVASGQIDGTIFPLTNPWDSAAAKIIVEEAGGTTSSIRGKAQRYDGTTEGIISAGNPELHQKLVELVAHSL